MSLKNNKTPNVLPCTKELRKGAVKFMSSQPPLTRMQSIIRKHHCISVAERLTQRQGEFTSSYLTTMLMEFKHLIRLTPSH